MSQFAVHCPMQTGSEESAAVLLDYVDRRLDAATMERIDRHVDQCAECRRMVEGQRAVLRAMDEWRPEPVPASFDSQLAARLASEQEKQDWWASVNPWRRARALWRPAMPLAAAACLLLVVAGLWRSAGPGASSPREFEKKAVLQDPQQLEDTLSDLEMLRQLGVADGGAAARQAL